jgi:ubiquitin fusion degradation protein 1
MLFQLTSERSGKSTHAGVLEFIAEEGRVYVPRWMMISLGLEEGELIAVSNKHLPQGKFVKIEPQSVEFLNISDPKAVYETTIKH